MSDNYAKKFDLKMGNRRGVIIRKIAIENILNIAPVKCLICGKKANMDHFHFFPRESLKFKGVI